MTWLPVVERELRVAARHRATYRIRFWAVLVMLGVFVWLMMEKSNNTAYSGRAGLELLMPLTLFAFLFAISIGVIATSDSVSEEKREGTLGLLFLTDLKGYDVILGKLAAHSINAFYALVAIMPVLGMPILLGAVTLLEFVKLIVALVAAIVFSLAAGIFVSTYSRSERKSMVFTFLLLLTVTCAPFLLMIWLSDELHRFPEKLMWRGLMFSPGFAVGMAMDPPAFWPAASYWCGIGLSLAGAIGLLLIAARKAPHSWTESAAKPVRRRVVNGGNFFARMRRPQRKLLDDNPFLWLAMRGEASQERVWFFILSIFAIWLVVRSKAGSIAWSYDVVFPTVIILNVGLKIWVVGEASRRFVEDRRNNAMEFLLSTPLDERQIIRGQWRALVRQFLGPIVFVLLWETAMAFASIQNDWNAAYEHARLPRLVSSMFFLPVDVVALGWAGMRLGMTSKGRGRAILIGLALIVLLPLVLTQLFITLADHLFYGIISRGDTEFHRTAIHFCASLMINLAVIFWARFRLVTSFRRLALAGASG